MDLTTKVWLANEIRIWGLVAAAVVAFISAAVGWKHARWQAELAAANEIIAQDKQRESNERITQLNRDTARLSAEADASRAQIAKAHESAAKANAEVAKANEHALEIQLLLNAEIKKNAWRRLNKDQHDRIANAVRSKLPIRLTVAFDGNDPEASVFASEIIKACEDGGATVNTQPSAVFVAQMPLFGIVVQARPGFAANSIEEAISEVAQIEMNESLKSFPEQNHSDLFVYVGHKPRAF